MRKYVRFVALVFGAALLLGVFAAPAVACDDFSGYCGSPGFWKNHPDAWQVCEIEVGGDTYTKTEAIELMSGRGKDKSITMFRALVAAKLSVMGGYPDCCIAETIAAADAWMAMHPAGSEVRANSCAWKYAECLYYKLDWWYNSGCWCCCARD
jgi:hypothetical protein